MECYAKYNAYGIGNDEWNQRYINLYKVSMVNDGDKRKAYVIDSEEIIFPDSLEEKVSLLRKLGFHNIYEFFPNFIDLKANNVFADYLFALMENKIVVLEKIYYTEIINDFSYLMTSVIYADVNTGKEYTIRLCNYGIETDKKVKYLQENGFTHISDSTLIKYFDKTNSTFARRLKK